MTDYDSPEHLQCVPTSEYADVLERWKKAVEERNALKSELASLKTPLEKLYYAAKGFMCRARECCAELNVNNYEEAMLLWVTHEELSKVLASMECQDGTFKFP